MAHEPDRPPPPVLPRVDPAEQDTITLLLDHPEDGDLYEPQEP